MRFQTKEDFVFAIATLCALLSFQGMLLLLVLGFWYVWEDAKWTAFDSKDFDQKIREKGMLNPWQKGN